MQEGGNRGEIATLYTWVGSRKSSLRIFRIARIIWFMAVSYGRVERVIKNLMGFTVGIELDRLENL
jgi:hypothetical protein